MKRREDHKPRLVVADPSLSDTRGHHFSLSQQITRGAQSQGMEVTWFTHADFAVPDTVPNVRIHRVFSATMYDQYRKDKSVGVRSDLDQTLLRELKAGITYADIRRSDHIIFHTGFGDIYRAIARYVSDLDWTNQPYLHICTPYDLETMPGKMPGRPLAEIFSGMRTLEAVDRKVFFWAETPQLASHFTAAYGFNVRALPLPPSRASTNNTGEDANIVTALYLGAAREEKGFLQLPEIIARLYDSHGRRGNLRFVIQCTPQIIGYIPSIKAAIRELGNYPASYVRLVDTVLSEGDYHSLLSACDVVLLLYNQKNYRIRGSGIAVEAICAGKCILTQKDTFCASLITQGGGMAVDSIDGAVKALDNFIENIDDYRERAQLQAVQYRKERSAEEYVRRFISRSDENLRVPFLPSSLVGFISPPLLQGCDF